MNSQPPTPSPPSSPVSSASRLPSSSVTSAVTVSRSVGAVLPQSGSSAESSLLTRLSTAPVTTTPYTRPTSLARPNARFLHRTEAHCPSHLTGKQRSNWLKAGKKAQNNQQILLDAPPFHWPQHSIDKTIFIHRLTSEQVLSDLIRHLATVRLFSVDTESTIARPGLPTLPSLIQIQAIHDLQRSTVLLIEVQHLPEMQSVNFQLCQRLCQLIFSSDNCFIAWGDLNHELRAFDSFRLFNSSDVRHCINLQTRFTSHWNLNHPHLPSCPVSSSTSAPYSSSEELICLVATDDLDSDVSFRPCESDSHLCTCPANIRPYKSINPMWSLQKAIYYTFNEALDKSFTLSIWSCGLDPLFYSSSSSLHGRITRNAMIHYAINDVLAPTRLYFHLFVNETVQLRSSMDQTVSSPPIIASASHSFASSQSTTTRSPEVPSNLFATSTLSHAASSSSQPDIYLLADSHGRCLTPLLHLSNHTVQVNAVSGLQFVNHHSSNLCATTILQSASISPILSNVKSVVLLIGTNSVRALPFTTIITQVTQLVSILRQLHPHLSSPHSITIIKTFPCYKLSRSFPSTSALLRNITSFNENLHVVSQSLGFSVLDLHVTSEYLALDNMHIHPHYHSSLAQILSTYINELSFANPSPASASADLIDDVITKASPPPFFANIPSSSSSDSESEQIEPTATQHKKPNRTVVSKRRRNQRGHAKRHQRRLLNILSRPVSPLWTLTQLKQYIRGLHIRFAFLSPIRNNILRISFDHETELLAADLALPESLFDEAHYREWLAKQTQ